MKKLVLTIGVIALVLSTGCVKKKVVPVVIKPTGPQIVIKPQFGSKPAPKPTQTQQPQTPPPAMGTPMMGGGMMLAQMAPVVFSYTLGVGGYWIWSKDFKPGEWVKFLVTTDNGKAYTVEIAFLKKLPDGNEWWRVSYIPKDPEEKPLIYEALFSSGMGELKRLRGKWDDKPAQELPVTQGSYVMKPVKLTKESIEGATVGVEVVKVPAGTFRAKHVKYGSLNGKGSVEWWIDNGVPGGVVRYVIRDEDGKVAFTADLVSFGSGATSILGSF